MLWTGLCLKVIKNMINYLFSISISINKFAELLILVGSAILIFGVLFKNPLEIIDNSILGNDQPGIMGAIFYPEKIQDFIRLKNKVVLGLIFLFCGFLISILSSSKKCEINFVKIMSLTLISAYVIGCLIAGYNRKDVIVGWRGDKCKYNWMVTKLLDKNYLNDKLSVFPETNQAQEYLIDTKTRLEFVTNALSIEIDYLFRNERNPSLQEIETMQLLIRNDIDNTGLFYYFFRPKRLLKDIFLT